MKLLVNYDPEFVNYKPVIGALVQVAGHSAASTDKKLDLLEILRLGEKYKFDGVLVANEETLGNLVNSTETITLSKYRGSRLNFSIPCIVGAPLDHLRNIRHGRWLYEKDIGKFRHVKEPVTQINYTLGDSYERLVQIRAALATNILAISIDIETDLCNRITCIGFSGLRTDLKTVTAIIPFFDFGVSHWASDDEFGFAIQICRDICNSNITKVFFNGGFDALHLLINHMDPNNFTIDCMGLAHSEFSELEKSLDFNCSVRLYDYYYWKDEAEEAQSSKDIQRYWTYCARDSWNTLRLFLTYVKEREPWTIPNYQRKFKITYPYLYTKFEGSLIDQEARERNKIEAIKIRDKAKTDLKIMSADPYFNPGSPKQVAVILFDIMGAKPLKGKRTVKGPETEEDKKKRERKSRTTKESALDFIRLQHPILEIFIDALQDFREKAKAVSTYFEFGQVNGRLLYDLNQWGADTARSTCRKASFRYFYQLENSKWDYDNVGAQIQNIPPYAKNMIIADEGYIMGEADNNKAEARCVAYMAVCLAMIEFLSDTTKDFYKVLSSTFFGMSYDDVTKELRNEVTKRVVHGKNYLMGADTFIEVATPKRLYRAMELLRVTDKTLKEFANWLLSLYDRPFPELEKWYTEIKLEVLRTNKLVSPAGYTRYFFGDITKDHKIFRNAVAHGPQNLNVMVLDKGLWRVYDRLVLAKEPGFSLGDYRLKAQIHDSIKFQVLQALKELAELCMRRCMDNPVKIKEKVMNIPVDFAYGLTWAEVKGG